MTKRVGYMLWTLGCVGFWLYFPYYMVFAVRMMVRMEPLSTHFLGSHLHHVGILALLSLMWLGGMRAVFGPDMREWP